jgi:hypothetical protein
LHVAAIGPFQGDNGLLGVTRPPGCVGETLQVDGIELGSQVGGSQFLVCLLPGMTI